MSYMSFEPGTKVICVNDYTGTRTCKPIVGNIYTVTTSNIESVMLEELANVWSAHRFKEYNEDSLQIIKYGILAL
jgi:hypothetical protein